MYCTACRSLLIVTLLGASGCPGGLRDSPEGTYRGTLHAFEFRSDGTFAYEATTKPLRIHGTWISTLEVERDHENRGHIDLMIDGIEVGGEPATRADDSSGVPIYRVGQANVGWWFHLPEHAFQEREMRIEHNRAGQIRAPSSASFTSWSANPE